MIKKLKELRIKNGYTQENMVKMLGLRHKSHYSQIESGAIKPSLELANKISKIFHRSIEEIFFDNQVHDTRTQMTKVAGA